MQVTAMPARGMRSFHGDRTQVVAADKNKMLAVELGRAPARRLRALGAAAAACRLNKAGAPVADACKCPPMDCAAAVRCAVSPSPHSLAHWHMKPISPTVHRLQSLPTPSEPLSPKLLPARRTAALELRRNWAEAGEETSLSLQCMVGGGGGGRTG